LKGVSLARDHRIEQNGQRLNFTCANFQYRTDIDKGQAHGQCPNRGSVFTEPLVDSEGYSLWLEHLLDREDREYYWLMWYDFSGVPTMPMSARLNRDDIANMQRLFASFIP
jgi:hypothetical protein